MQFEVRFAETGNCFKLPLNNFYYVHQLMTFIQSNYHIEKDDQVLITKAGKILLPDLVLAQLLTDEKADKTITSKHESSNTI
jgi:hypothetical protein